MLKQIGSNIEHKVRVFLIVLIFFIEVNRNKKFVNRLHKLFTPSFSDDGRGQKMMTSENMPEYISGKAPTRLGV